METLTLILIVLVLILAAIVFFGFEIRFQNKNIAEYLFQQNENIINAIYRSNVNNTLDSNVSDIKNNIDDYIKSQDYIILENMSKLYRNTGRHSDASELEQLVDNAKNSIKLKPHEERLISGIEDINDTLDYFKVQIMLAKNAKVKHKLNNNQDDLGAGLGNIQYS